jgi:hypothetical protein
MNCNELREDYDLFAIGLAGEPESSEIRRHLDRRCETCVAGIKRARELTVLLSASAPDAEPSRKLRRRILTSVGYEQHQFGWTPLLAAVAMLSLVAAVYFGGRERNFAEEAARLRQQMRSQTIELTRLNEAFAILNGPGTVETSFGAGAPKPPKGKVYVNPQRGVLLIASDLPPAPAGKTYEMWMIPKGGKPIPAGLFQSQNDGAAMHLQPGPVDTQTLAVVAVTIENEGGTAEPTLPPVFAAALQ